MKMKRPASLNTEYTRDSLNRPRNTLKKKKKHTVDQKFPCPAQGCSATYTRRHNLKTHFRRCHREIEESHPEVFVPLKSTKVGKDWQCPVENCHCGYSRKGDLKYHFTRKHSELCYLYPDICKSKSSKENKKHLCPIDNCSCGYLRKADLKTHFISKHPDKIYMYPSLKPRDAVVECTFENCGEEFYSTRELMKHVSGVHDVNAYYESLDEDNDTPSNFSSQDETEETEDHEIEEGFTKRRPSSSINVNSLTLRPTDIVYILNSNTNSFVENHPWFQQIRK